MLVLAALVYGLSTAFAAPVPAAQPPTTLDPANTRTLRDIIVSCLTTIFACTWVSLHPNIPAPELEDSNRSFWRKTWRNVKRFARRDLSTFFVAVLFPEYIVGWAFRQRLTAARQVEHMGSPKFTLTHAFFIIMGGIHKKTDSGSYPLDRYQVASLMGVEIDYEKDVIKSKGGEAVLTLPYEAELQDRSKADWLGKLLAVVQTLWFVIQCIARGMERLPITELEVITLAYAVLNVAIYIAWWDKPNRVDCPIVITQDVKPEDKRDEENLFFHAVNSVMGSQDGESKFNNRTEVPRFYSGNPEDSHLYAASSISFLLGAAFGAIHCIDWYFTFTSLMEQKLWRISSLFLALIPLAGIALMTVARFTDPGEEHVWDTIVALFVAGPVILFSPLLLIGYLVARFATIYIAFHSLRSLPADAFIDVQWTTLIPHI